MASALGVGTGTLVHIAAAAAGLSALIASSATAFGALRYVGAAYLVFLGIRTLRGEPAAAPESAPVAGGSLRRAYLEGALVNVLNAKVGLFFVAFLPQFVDPSRGGAAAQILVLGAVFFVTALTLDLLYAVAAGSVGAWVAARPSALRRRRTITGATYLVLGAVAAVSPLARPQR